MKNRAIQIICGLVLLFAMGSFSAKTKPPFGIKTVVIDAGHGGKDPGCHGDEYKEKDVALAIALKLGAYIEKYMKDVKVIYTRDKDVFVDLDERAAIANRNHADLFICIHCNSACSYNKKTKKEHCNEDAYGAETYVMGLYKMNANFEVAKRENSVITMEDNYQSKYGGFDPNSDEGFIAGKIAQGVVMDNSLNFAAKVQASFKEKAGRMDKGVKQAGFLVLWRTQMPSVLIETGFLTNPDDHDYLGDTKGQDNMAASIFRAFRQYKDDLEGRKGVVYDDDVEKMTAYDAPKKVHLHKRDPDAEILDSVPKKDSLQIKINAPVKLSNDSGVVFRVQFLSSDKQVPPDSDKFKIINDVTEYSINGAFKYAAGNCRTPEEASKLQTYVRKNGYPDAFVIAFKDGKRISYNDAVKLLKD